MLNGVRQGCLLVPILVPASPRFDKAGAKTTEKHRNDIERTPTTRLEDLDIADDVSLLSHNLQAMQFKLTRLAKILSEDGP